MSDEHRYLLDALNAIPVESLSYSEWIACGMALHECGFSLLDWQRWSATDTRTRANGTPYYSERETESKWRSFGNGSDRVGSGTIIHMAEMRGWRQPTSGMGEALDWDGTGIVQAGPDALSADAQPIEDADEGDWDPCGMLSDYLAALFDDDDVVGYVVNCWEQDGELKPKRGDWSRTAGELRQELARPGATMDKVLGSWDERAGAWIRFNPLDGHGCGNANVTDYRYALVESDVLNLDKQFPAIKDMRLPCAAVVSSGGKSVHAIVRVDAKGKDEYAKRVKWLYDYCDRHGFTTDKQNKNASRLSRMPGVTRNGRRQLLLATNIGEPDWESWQKWAEESEDNLPDEIVGGIGQPVELNPMLIGLTEHDCILRRYSKLILVGDSKMGKSTTLIDLAEAICVGGEWLGMRCAQGKVYYINLELDERDFRDRLNKVWERRPEGADPDALRLLNDGFVHMPMKGRADMLWEIAPTIVRRVLRFGPPGTFAAIIVDPIYKVNGGDDNDAKSVAKFTNTLDLIAQRCGSAIIYAHHHPKGATGGRKAIDRMSGSGVYGRDADTVLDFSPLFVPGDLWAKYEHKPLFRAEVKCRSFGYRKPINCLFDYPRFYRDDSEELAKLKVLGEDPRREGQITGGQVNGENERDRWRKKLLALHDAFDNDPHNIAPDIAEFGDDFVEGIEWGRFGIDKAFQTDTVRKWIDGTTKGASLIREHFEFVGQKKELIKLLKEIDSDEFG